MVLLSFFSLGIITFMKPITDLLILQSFQSNTALEGRLALLRMVREIDTVKDRTSISQATASAFSFTDVNNQAISYGLSSGTLTRNNVTLAKSVSSLQFQYIGLAASGTDTVLAIPVLSPNTDIRRINMTVTVSANGQSSTVRSQSEPRNLY